MLNDTQIIENTKITVEKDGTALMSILPPGYENPIQQKASTEEAARKHIIAWCEHVRGTMKADEEARLEEQAALKAARKRDSEAGITPDSDSGSEGSSPSPAAISDDPIEYARANREAWHDKVVEADEQVSEWKAKRKEARLNFENWEKIVESLRHEQDD